MRPRVVGISFEILTVRTSYDLISNIDILVGGPLDLYKCKKLKVYKIKSSIA